MDDLGYRIGPFTRFSTREELRRLHDFVLQSKNIHVAQLSDQELRKTLIRFGHLVGPINNLTRGIYQRRLLEILANERIEENVESSSAENSDEETNSFERPSELYPVLQQRKPKGDRIPVIQYSMPEEKRAKKNPGWSLYIGIVLFIASMIFTFYLYFEK